MTMVLGKKKVCDRESTNVLDNHLGNVLAVVSDRKIAVEDQGNPGTVEYYEADVVSAQDYHPFGMIMPGRSVSAGEYRYGFGGQEMDNEISGTGNSYTAEYWQYDSRLGRRWNVDPVVKHHESSYAAFANNPILLIDPDGRDTVEFHQDDGEITSHDEADGDDVFFIVDDDGRVQDDEGEYVSESFEEGTLEDIETGRTTLDDDGGLHEFSVLRMRGDENATDAFTFLADNTNVEWSQTMLGIEGGQGLNYLTSSHDPRTERGFARMWNTQFQDGYTFRGHRHNHPGGNPNPSSADRNIARILGNRTPRPVFEIYTSEDGQFHQYNQHGRILEIDMDGIEITPD